MSFARYVERPIGVANALAQGQAGGGYLEAYLIVSSLISGLAAVAWPGRGKDHKRFVELLAHYAVTATSACRVSIPFLLRSRRRSGHTQDVAALEQLRSGLVGFAHDDRIVTGDEVDCTEVEARTACPSLDLSELRKSSYASILYEHVRCGVVHEYQLSNEATSRPMSSRTADVSYSNMLVLDRPVDTRSIHDGGRRMGTTLRQIHFSLGWLTTLVLSAASGLDAATPGPPFADPQTWWLQGR